VGNSAAAIASWLTKDEMPGGIGGLPPYIKFGRRRAWVLARPTKLVK
jgi:hypothetical protein